MGTRTSIKRLFTTELSDLFGHHHRLLYSACLHSWSCDCNLPEDINACQCKDEEGGEGEGYEKKQKEKKNRMKKNKKNQ